MISCRRSIGTNLLFLTPLTPHIVVEIWSLGNFVITTLTFWSRDPLNVAHNLLNFAAFLEILEVKIVT